MHLSFNWILFSIWNVNRRVHLLTDRMLLQIYPMSYKHDINIWKMRLRVKNLKGNPRVTANQKKIFGSLVHITDSEHRASPELKHSHSERWQQPEEISVASCITYPGAFSVWIMHRWRHPIEIVWPFHSYSNHSAMSHTWGSDHCFVCY